MSRALSLLMIILISSSSNSWADNRVAPKGGVLHRVSSSVNKMRNNRFNRELTTRTVDKVHVLLKEGRFDRVREMGTKLLGAKTRSGDVGLRPNTKQRAAVKKIMRRLDAAELTRTMDAAQNLLLNIRMVNSGQFKPDQLSSAKRYGWQVATELQKLTPKLKVGKSQRKQALALERQLTREMQLLQNRGLTGDRETASYEWSNGKNNLLNALSKGLSQNNPNWYSETAGYPRGKAPRWTNLSVGKMKQTAPNFKQILKDNPHWGSIQQRKMYNKFGMAGQVLAGGIVGTGLAAGLPEMAAVGGALQVVMKGLEVRDNHVVHNPQVVHEALERGEPLPAKSMQNHAKRSKKALGKLQGKQAQSFKAIAKLEPKVGKTGKIYNYWLNSPAVQISGHRYDLNVNKETQGFHQRQLRLIKNASLDQHGVEKRARTLITKARRYLAQAKKDPAQNVKLINLAHQQARQVFELVRGEIQPRSGQLKKAQQILKVR